MDNANDQIIVTHYACQGSCKGAAAVAGNCQTAGCPRLGEPLLPCSCTDGQHQKSENPQEREERARE